ncbi:hypothetical protein AJ80_06191 [Polytolypa hystricis UAMH7299]|uniref:Type 1 phosphatases regulator n=1 Tax=Polytolypa hystricis (strain UAMH7299) TaxID=1447883 RepID=A0A2B7XYE5_POLH7|nr:hypothetical protein AJ80_06191 [Polytolypa hystricis UAMH7299]
MSRTRDPRTRGVATTAMQLDPSNTTRSTNDGAEEAGVIVTLRLRGEDDAGLNTAEASNRRIRWAEDVVDNEGLGRKKSKVCCIFHKARPVGESSSESDSSDSSSDDDDNSDSDVGNGEARMANGGRSSSSSSRPHAHSHDNDCGHHHEDGDGRQPHTRRKPARRRPNAYERMPRYKKKEEKKE